MRRLVLSVLLCLTLTGNVYAQGLGGFFRKLAETPRATTTTLDTSATTATADAAVTTSTADTSTTVSAADFPTSVSLVDSLTSGTAKASVADLFSLDVSEKKKAGKFVYSIPKPGDPDAGGLGGWRVDLSLPSALASLRSAEGEDGEGELTLEFPRLSKAGIVRNVCEDREALARGRFLGARIFVPGTDDTLNLSVQLVAFHDQWGGFSTLPSRPLRPGKWTKVYWLLGAGDSDWESLGGTVAWNDTMRFHLSRVGFRFYSKPPEFSPTGGSREKEAPSEEALRIRIADVAIEGLDDPRPSLEVVERPRFAAGEGSGRAPAVRRGKRFEMAFDLSRAYENPYDPDCVAVDVDYFTPSGTSLTLPAFYFQDYLRRRLSNGAEQCEPRGEACWKARFTPREAGTHAYRIRVADRFRDEVYTTTRTFEVLDAPFRGFVRLDPDDGHYMSFDDGSFFYPVGLIIRCPYDVRCTYHYEFEPTPGKGTFVYDKVMRKMAESGMNFTRIWMSAWWLSLEWNKGIRGDYEGLGRYSQMSAWRLDHILGLAEELGIYVDLTFQNHGQFSLRIDNEWADNPYNSENGGSVASPEWFWTDETSRDLVRKRLRYIAARWASSPAVAWWELSNEIDLVHKYKAHYKSIADWHGEMAGYLRSVDPYGHITTTHYIGHNFDPKMFKLPEMEVVQANGYDFDMVRSIPRMLNKFRNSSPFKPSIINEFGIGGTRAALQHNLHSGLWASSVYPFCGPAIFWYFQYVDGSDQYYQYEALTRFHEGEDYRNRDFIENLTVKVQTGEEEEASPADGGGEKKTEAEKPDVEIIGMGNIRAARLWIYDRRIYREVYEKPVIRPVDPTPLEIGQWEVGRYRIEFWDTWKGGLIPGATLTVTHSGGPFRFTTPPFERDIACKIERIGDGPE